MAAVIRLIVFGFLALSVVYIGVSLYSRSVRRRKLVAKWVEDQRAGRTTMDEVSFVEQGLEDYDSSLRRKLILGVYVVPVCVIGLIVYLTNFQ